MVLVSELEFDESLHCFDDVNRGIKNPVLQGSETGNNFKLESEAVMNRKFHNLSQSRQIPSPAINLHVNNNRSINNMLNNEIRCENSKYFDTISAGSSVCILTDAETSDGFTCFPKFSCKILVEDRIGHDSGASTLRNQTYEYSSRCLARVADCCYDGSTEISKLNGARTITFQLNTNHWFGVLSKFAKRLQEICVILIEYGRVSHRSDLVFHTDPITPFGCQTSDGSVFLVKDPSSDDGHITSYLRKSTTFSGGDTAVASYIEAKRYSIPSGSNGTFFDDMDLQQSPGKTSIFSNGYSDKENSNSRRRTSGSTGHLEKSTDKRGETIGSTVAQSNNPVGGDGESSSADLPKNQDVRGKSSGSTGYLEKNIGQRGGTSGSTVTVMLNPDRRDEQIDSEGIPENSKSRGRTSCSTGHLEKNTDKRGETVGSSVAQSNNSDRRSGGSDSADLHKNQDVRGRTSGSTGPLEKKTDKRGKTMGSTVAQSNNADGESSSADLPKNQDVRGKSSGSTGYLEKNIDQRGGTSGSTVTVMVNSDGRDEQSDSERISENSKMRGRTSGSIGSQQTNLTQKGETRDSAVTQRSNQHVRSLTCALPVSQKITIGRTRTKTSGSTRSLKKNTDRRGETMGSSVAQNNNPDRRSEGYGSADLRKNQDVRGRTSGSTGHLEKKTDKRGETMGSTVAPSKNPDGESGSADLPKNQDVKGKSSGSAGYLEKNIDQRGGTSGSTVTVRVIPNGRKGIPENSKSRGRTSCSTGPLKNNLIQRSETRGSAVTQSINEHVRSGSTVHLIKKINKRGGTSGSAVTVRVNPDGRDEQGDSDRIPENSSSRGRISGSTRPLKKNTDKSNSAGTQNKNTDHRDGTSDSTISWKNTVERLLYRIALALIHTFGKDSQIQNQTKVVASVFLVLLYICYLPSTEALQNGTCYFTIPSIKEEAHLFEMSVSYSKYCKGNVRWDRGLKHLFLGGIREPAVGNEYELDEGKVSSTLKVRLQNGSSASLYQATFKFSMGIEKSSIFIKPSEMNVLANGVSDITCRGNESIFVYSGTLKHPNKTITVGAFLTFPDVSTSPQQLDAVVLDTEWNDIMYESKINLTGTCSNKAMEFKLNIEIDNKQHFNVQIKNNITQCKGSQEPYPITPIKVENEIGKIVGAVVAGAGLITCIVIAFLWQRRLFCFRKCTGEMRDVICKNCRAETGTLTRWRTRINDSRV